MEPLPIVDGWIWRQQWEAPFEGPFSICAKAMIVNAAKFGPLWDWVAARDHTRSILGHPEIRPHICCNRLRFCEECMASGFHASIFQIWRLKVCPIHNSPLLTSCRRCRTCTPPFPLLDAPRSAPTLKCPRCQAPYGGRQESLHPAYWDAPAGIHKLAGPYERLAWLKQFEIEARNLKKWESLGTRNDDMREEVSGTRMLELFTAVRRDKRPFKECLVTTLGPCKRALRTDGLPLPEKVKMNVLRGPWPTPPGPRHYVPSLLAFESLCVRPSYDVLVPVSSKVPQLCHANTIWHKQFGPTYPNYYQKHKDGIQVSSFNVTPADNRWQARWVAAKAIASQWNQVLRSLEASGEDSEKAAALLACSDFWCRRLVRWGRSYSPILIFEVKATQRKYLAVL